MRLQNTTERVVRDVLEDHGSTPNAATSFSRWPPKTASGVLRGFTESSSSWESRSRNGRFPGTCESAQGDRHRPGARSSRITTTSSRSSRRNRSRQRKMTSSTAAADVSSHALMARRNVPFSSTRCRRLRCFASTDVSCDASRSRSPSRQPHSDQPRPESTDEWTVASTANAESIDSPERHRSANEHAVSLVRAQRFESARPDDELTRRHSGSRLHVWRGGSHAGRNIGEAQQEKANVPDTTFENACVFVDALRGAACLALHRFV